MREQGGYAAPLFVARFRHMRHENAFGRAPGRAAAASARLTELFQSEAAPGIRRPAVAYRPRSPRLVPKYPSRAKSAGRWAWRPRQGRGLASCCPQRIALSPYARAPTHAARHPSPATRAVCPDVWPEEDRGRGRLCEARKGRDPSERSPARRYSAGYAPLEGDGADPAPREAEVLTGGYPFEGQGRRPGCAVVRPASGHCQGTCRFLPEVRGRAEQERDQEHWPLS